MSVLEQFFRLKNVVFFLYWIQSSSAAITGYGDLLVNSTFICDTCVNLCETSRVDDILVGDCQRGCRLFDTLFIQNPLFVKFDEAVAFTGCQNSCSEAYGSEAIAVTACSDGCNIFQIEYLIKRKEVEQELEEAERSIFLMLFKPYFESSEKLRTSQVLKVDDFQQVINTRLDSNLVHTKSRNWRQSPSIAPPTVIHTFAEGLRNFPAPTPSPTAPVTSWITPSSVTIFVLGIFVILGLTCFCCISSKRNSNTATTAPKSSVESEPPPSYDEAVCVH